MLADFQTYQFIDADGRPEGGQTFGPGFCISWQRGPLGRGENRLAPNGAFVETIIAAARDRIEFYNDNGFYCDENADAAHYLSLALERLHARTDRREQQGVEGTHQGS